MILYVLCNINISFINSGIGLWHAGHKRPNFIFPKAHSNEWISSICALPYTDLVVSGSSDGNLNFWEFSKSRQILSKLYSFPLVRNIDQNRNYQTC